MKSMMLLIQMTDSSFPVGTFSFSAGLEAAVNAGIINDCITLEQYVQTMLHQSATTDAVAARTAYRATLSDNYPKITTTDKTLISYKMNEEVRLMQLRMGKKLTELACKLSTDTILARFLADIENLQTPGTYSVSQGISFAALGLTERQLFVSQQYGTANMILSAALRCCKVSHYETQRILYQATEYTNQLYNQTKNLTIEEMYSFMPQADIFASLHENDRIRMFMN